MLKMECVIIFPINSLIELGSMHDEFEKEFIKLRGDI
jgi:hypothetical protein